MKRDSVFTKIINREIPAAIIYETDDIIVIKDIHPQAPIHFLIIPKKPVENIPSMHDSEFAIGEMIFRAAYHLSKTIEGASDFKLVINNGSKAGQVVFHLHAHFLSGKMFKE